MTIERANEIAYTKRTCEFCVYYETDEDCMNCDRVKPIASHELHEYHDIVMAALRAQAERDNPQLLTLDELRNMRNRPVWIADLLMSKCSRWHLISENAQWGLIAIDAQCDKWKNHLTGCIYNLDNPNDAYGKTWLAYRYPPKETTHADR